MKCKIAVPAALLLLALLRPAVGIALPQDEANKSKKDDASKTDEKKNSSTVKVKIKISAEGRSSLPSGSRIEWEGEGTCKNVTGRNRLESDKPTSVNLPACQVKLTVFMTGYDAAAVTVDVAGNAEKYGDPIRIAVKHHGAAEVDW
jgi:hypothetical protein